MSTIPEFDVYAESYDDDLNRALAVSGEDKNYFAHGRIQWLVCRLSQLHEQPHTVLDYGCGIGDTSSLLQQTFHARQVLGLDISRRSLELAAQRNGNATCEFKTFDEYLPQAAVDLAYCNGVFHHIPVEMRDAAVDYIFRCLRPGGIFAFWENNPWNPGTRYVMSQCVFDREAVTLTPPSARGLLRKRGFAVLHADYLFFSPRLLKLLRPLERQMAWIPLGAQYLLLCRKPAA